MVSSIDRCQAGKHAVDKLDYILFDRRIVVTSHGHSVKRGTCHLSQMRAINISLWIGPYNKTIVSIAAMPLLSYRQQIADSFSNKAAVAIKNVYQ